MNDIVKVRIPPQLEPKLLEYCARHGVTRAEAVARALDQYPDCDAGGVNPCSLAADLIPRAGVKTLQSDNFRVLARKTFCGGHFR